MKTTPLYLTDPYLREMEAMILEVLPENEGTYRLILDQTVFYPMGGGQPTDQGTLIVENGSSIEVYQVLLKEGEINHFVKSTAQIVAGTKVKGAIDWERRLKNMKVHTGAHIIDFALYQLGHSPSVLHPIKGDHGKKPFIQYSGVLGKDIKHELQQQVDALIASNLKFSWTFEPLEKLEKEALYLQPGLPKNKPLRALTLEGVGTVADGGTILATTQEVGTVTILAIDEVEGKETVIHYKV